MVPGRHLLSSARIPAGCSLLAVLLAMAACGGSAPAPAPTATPSPTEALPTPTSTPIAGATPSASQRAVLEEIKARAAEVRELEPLAEVECRFLTREAAEAYLRRLVEEEMRVHFREAQPVYELLGFISPGDDLMDLALRLVSSQIVGLYDTDEETMFVIGQDDELDTMGVITLAHEFVHALQDQHFDLDALLEQEEADEDWDWDVDLARTALVEGDATVAETDYVLRFIGLGDLFNLDFAEIERLTSELEDFPEALQQELFFPYTAGADFVTTLFDDGGWMAINGAFDAPPTTTEQILHPEKYLAGETRHEIALPDLTPELGEGWELQTSNTLGEFLLSNHLDTQLSRAEAENAAAGWGGDRWALYSDGAAGMLLLLVVEWDAPEELYEFFAAYVDWLDSRSSGAWEPSADDAALWQGERESVYASQEGGRATIIVSTEAEALEQARDALQLP
jgi:hypothetical protein